LAINGDGAAAVVGAYGAYSFAGAAYLFTKSGATWSTGALLGTGSAGASLGNERAVAMARTGASALVAGYQANSNDGEVYAFTRSGGWSC
jgi:hypothetical protein